MALKKNSKTDEHKHAHVRNASSVEGEVKARSLHSPKCIFFPILLFAKLHTLQPLQPFQFRHGVIMVNPASITIFWPVMLAVSSDDNQSIVFVTSSTDIFLSKS
jgi:hypothetical protein